MIILDISFVLLVLFILPFALIYEIVINPNILMFECLLTVADTFTDYYTAILYF
jgi:hypothetical protein